MLDGEGDIHVTGAHPGVRQASQAREELEADEEAKEEGKAVAVSVSSTVPTTANEKLHYYLRDRTKYLHVQNEIPAQVTSDLSLVNNYYVSISDPQDMTFINPGQSTSDRIFATVYTGLLNLYLQCALLVPTFLFLVFSAVRTESSPVFLLVYTIFIGLEVLAIWAYERGARFAAGLWWELVWVGASIVVVSIYVAYPTSIVCGLLLIVHWMFMARLTVLQMSRALRVFCASDRRCYIAEGVVLDLAYITRNVLAMGWPARGTEAFYRNPWEEVVRFLHRKYARLSYHVISLCSERSTAPFPLQSVYCVDDHNPAELAHMIAFCCEVADYVMADPYNRVVAVHCKGGKGRTGAMICAYLMYCGLCRSAEAALRHFSLMRSRVGYTKLQGVQTPSQARYVHYFDRLINEQPGMAIPSRPRRVQKLVLHHIPPLWLQRGVEHLWMAVITRPCTERNVVYLSNRTVTFNAQVPDPSTYDWRRQVKDLFHNDEEVLYMEANEMDSAESSVTGYVPDRRAFRAVGTAADTLELTATEDIPVLDGDVTFKFFFYKNNPNPLRPPVQFWLHTGFEHNATIRLDRNELDGPSKDTKQERYPGNFEIELQWEDARRQSSARE
ncbi:tyrosine phosphatase isoform [Leptomonas pyrrhocoris]|uniref:Tyrosine phosphatase isoform n=1 Tax=Leptomonas pyrrhocoris TaxID=157538 RepID=A0A0N0DWT9_LEPPY|nr:tyrosine phosphatase isoform [Leptomonas pyrrhocoris]KPA82215.1 tyrosine phosphatase isoform [Leptomonas pyrrhocoris]|eukprot:XP_015660654.1 tyrosine phosphatase isoform [Leptomonas pyrrhocoris]